MFDLKLSDTDVRVLDDILLERMDVSKKEMYDERFTEQAAHKAKVRYEAAFTLRERLLASVRVATLT